MRNLKIQGINMEVTPAIDQHFREKLNGLDKYIDQNDESVECNARVSKETGRAGDMFKAEVSLHTAGKNFGAVAENADMYVAIDDVKEAVERKIISYKDKKRSIFKRGASKAKDLLRGFKKF